MNNDTALILLLADLQRKIVGLQAQITERDEIINELRELDQS